MCCIPSATDNSLLPLANDAGLKPLSLAVALPAAACCCFLAVWACKVPNAMLSCSMQYSTSSACLLKLVNSISMVACRASYVSSLPAPLPPLTEGRSSSRCCTDTLRASIPLHTASGEPTTCCCWISCSSCCCCCCWDLDAGGGVLRGVGGCSRRPMPLSSLRKLATAVLSVSMCCWTVVAVRPTPRSAYQQKAGLEKLLLPMPGRPRHVADG
mmetsp:Transcript_18312/g.51383  ORF Transcript_18312/g.51383 Transcript_18312/m.51383 type:complete len:213 (+) Transcript_18312:127-765(+)